MRRHVNMKTVGDQQLLALVAELQQELANSHSLDMTTLDWSIDNEMAAKILQAKYNFSYNEARRRHTKSSRLEGIVTQ